MKYSNYVYRCTFVAAIGGFLFGYDTAVIAGAIGFIQQKYQLSPAMMGWIASCALIGCVLGAMTGGVMSDWIGRKKVLVISGILFFVSSLGIMIPLNLNYFVFFRLIGGVGIGIASMVVSMYISEIAPAAIRGRLISINQLGVVTGILIIFFVNAYIASLHTELWTIDIGWRYMFGSGIIPSFVFIALLFSVPESPRWLGQKARWQEAATVLNKLNMPDEAMTELEAIKISVQGETGSFSDLLKPGLRIVTIIGIGLAFFSQITGINAIMYYAPEIFKATGDGVKSALLQTIMIGIFNIISTVIAILYVDKLGRKLMLMVGSIGMAVCLALIGAFFFMGMAKGYWVVSSILGYISFFGISLGPLAFVVIAEIFPTRVRAKAISVAIFSLWLSTFAVSLVFPAFLKFLGGAYTFWLFMGFAVLSFLFIWKVVPETKGKTLEEIEQYWSKK
ncbi:MAG: transporter [Mucilaginibacter sp.]|nr:transporter [Mucilaginibacter sp.]